MRTALASFAVLILAGCGGNEQGLRAAQSLIASSSIQSDVVLFGDATTARVTALVDEQALDPDQVRVQPGLKPFEQLGSTKVIRRDLGRYTYLRYEFVVRCITLACVPRSDGDTPTAQSSASPYPLAAEVRERRAVSLGSARLLEVAPDGQSRTLRELTWPQIQSASRLNFADTTVAGLGFPFRASVTPVQRPTVRVSAPLVGMALIFGSAALLAFAAVILVRRLRSRPLKPAEHDAEPDRLDQVLSLITWARSREDMTDRRGALEVLVGVLDTDGHHLLADRARALAWSRSSPQSEAIDGLVATVREDYGRGS